MTKSGVRQVGKSTLIKHVFPEYNRANFDDQLTGLQAKEEPKLFFMNNPCPLFIDEVQKENSVLDKVNEKQRGMGVILCLIDKKTYLRENLIALPIEYI